MYSANGRQFDLTPETTPGFYKRTVHLQAETRPHLQFFKHSPSLCMTLKGFILNRYQPVLCGQMCVSEKDLKLAGMMRNHLAALACG